MPAINIYKGEYPLSTSIHDKILVGGCRAKNIQSVVARSYNWGAHFRTGVSDELS